MVRRFSDVNYYAVLGVASSATRAQIKTAYRAKVRSAHPDRGGDHDRFALIAEAWEVLGEENKRAHYDADRSLRARAARPYARFDRPERSDDVDAPAASSERPAAPGSGEGLTDGQRWRAHKRRF